MSRAPVKKLRSIRENERVGSPIVLEAETEILNPKVMLVTPQQAEVWLSKNLEQNRNVSFELVASYASDMKAGKWLLNGEAIKLGRNDVLYDGQHRLWAVLEADVPVKMLVIEGLSEDAIATIDQGRKRSHADSLKMLKGQENAKKYTSMVNIIRALTTDARGAMTYHQIETLGDKYKGGLEWALKTMPSSRKWDAATISGALAFAYKTDPVGINEFAIQLRSGEGLHSGDPAFALRYYIQERLPVIRDTGIIISKKTLSCARAHLQGRQLVRVEGSDEVIAYFAKAHGITV